MRKKLPRATSGGSNQPLPPYMQPTMGHPPFAVGSLIIFDTGTDILATWTNYDPSTGLALPEDGAMWGTNRFAYPVRLLVDGFVAGLASECEQFAQHQMSVRFVGLSIEPGMEICVVNISDSPSIFTKDKLVLPPFVLIPANE